MGYTTLIIRHLIIKKGESIVQEYHKLIRDRIPEIIEAAGNDYEVELLEGKEYLDALHDKLKEEVEEYLEGGELEELADILEVIYAILDYKGMSRDKLEDIRLKKKDKRGAFEKGLYLLRAEK